MRTETEAERQAAAATLKEVTSKLEEALRLSRRLEERESQSPQRRGTAPHSSR